MGYTNRMAMDTEIKTNRPAETSTTDGVATSPERKPVTLRTLHRMKSRGEKFACLTCYDATTARWLERAGVPVLLIGDTAAEMILGYPSTIHAPLDFLIQLTAAVKRGAPRTFVMGDMPFMSYQAEDAEAIRNAGRFMTEGTADAVKLEVDRHHAPLIEKISRAGVPVVAHIGSKPQHAKRHGGYASTGKTLAEAKEILADAIALQDAGASILLVEACPNEVTAKIVEKARVPVIGCGAGEACDGQIVVTQDLFGLTDWQPAFARPIAGLGDAIVSAAERWIDMVRRSDLGEHPYCMKDDAASDVKKL
ncbi:MAG: 3-methyl-2-oxobutanoate hydroxymethyltransferase [Phycisphaerales bacterium]|nr:MAG: 3-methyl-2-oxobutanoate hydroxymethyltransferase [Phycisphaerales bacterium]